MSTKLPVLTLLLAAAAASLLALDDYATLTKRLQPAPVSIQPASEVTMAIPGEAGEYQLIRSTTQATLEGSVLTVLTDGPNTESTYQMDLLGNILEYRTRTKPGGDAGRSGNRGGFGGGGSGDRVSTQMVRLPDGSYRQTTRHKDGREETKELRLGGKDILFIQLPYAIQKALKSGLRQGFNFDGVFGPDARQNFDLRLVSTTAPMASFSQYRYPPAIATALNHLDIAVVAELSLTGVAGLFYPHKIYLAYGPAPDHYLRAFWGGEPGKDFFQVEAAPASAASPARSGDPRFEAAP